jgi:hypothetical protein
VCAAAVLDDGDAARYWEEEQENKVAKGELNKYLPRRSEILEPPRGRVTGPSTRKQSENARV